MSEKFENQNNDECCNDNHCGDDCDCGHEHVHEHEYETIMLTLDDETQLKCIVLGMFDIEEKTYIALLPEGKDEVLLYQYEEKDDNIDLTNIESDEEFEIVSKTFLNLIDETEEN